MLDVTGIPHLSGSAAAAVGWFYLVTNSVRVITYIPQIIAVWRCTDGARAVSLLTWGSWMISNLTAVAYGALVVNDVFFAAISTVNFIGCATVTAIAARRRGLLRRPRWLARSLTRANSHPTTSTARCYGSDS